MNPTTEQSNIIKLVATEANIAISARAGTGKTSTLKLIAQSYPELTFGAIYFNKANVDELNASFSKPSNLIGTTIHGAAYKAIMLGGFSKKLSPYLDFNDIPQEHLDNLCQGIGIPVQNYRKESINFTKIILDVIKEFCKSDEYNIEQTAVSILPDLLESYHEGIEDDIIWAIIQHWKHITSSNNAKITHDVYLKMFHLGEYQLTELWDSQAKYSRKIDVLFLDEAQDSNPVTLGIIANQKVQKIIVGDPAQSIYGWRGAVGTMNNFDSWEQASLTTSFRFTPKIADIANVVLKQRGEGNLLTGVGKADPTAGKVILCRRNATIWKLAFTRALEGKFTYVESDFKTLKGDLYHISALMSGNYPKFPSKNLSMYKTKEDLIKASKIHDELATLINLGNTMRGFGGGGLAGSLKLLQEYLLEQKDPDVLCLSSIHKSKGLEWDEVEIAEDFIKLPEMEEFDIQELVDDMWLDEEMTSLLYVAITRAKECVTFPWYLQSEFSAALY